MVALLKYRRGGKASKKPLHDRNLKKRKRRKMKKGPQLSRMKGGRSWQERKGLRISAAAVITLVNPIDSMKLKLAAKQLVPLRLQSC